MPKFYCEYCGVYLTHSSPSGRKQHCRGRKHINNKIEYYNQLLIDQNQSGLLGNNNLKTSSMNPFARPLMSNLPFNIPGMMSSITPGLQPNINPSHINLPGILPSNITNLPILQNGQNMDSKNPQQPWNPSQLLPGQMPGLGMPGQMPNQLNLGQIGQIGPGQLMPGQLGPGQMSMGPGGPVGQMPPGMQLLQNKGNYMGNNNLPMPNPNATFIHPANVAQNQQGYSKM